MVFVGKFVVAIVLVSYLFASKRLDFRTLYSLCEQSNIYFVGIAFFLLLVNQYLVSVRLSALLKAHGIQIKIKEAFIINYIGMFFNNYLPGLYGGDVVRAYYLAKHQSSKGVESLGVLIFDRLISLCALSVLVIAGLIVSFETLKQSLLLIEQRWLLLILAVLVCLLGFMVLFLAGKKIISRKNKWFSWIDTNGLFYRMCHAAGYFVKKPRVVMFALAISFVSHLVTLTGVMIIANRIGDTPSFWKYMVAMPLTIILSSLPVSPGGIGWSEYLASILWGIGYLSIGAAVFAAWRIVSAIFSLPAGLVYLLFFKRGYNVKSIVAATENHALFEKAV